MPIFKYKGRDERGKMRTGIASGLSESDALAKLKKMNIEIEVFHDAENDLETKLNLLLRRVGDKDLVIFSRQLSVMIAANVPVVESLLILVDQTQNLSLKKMLSEIAFEVDSGALLSDAFAKRPKAFSEFFVNIVRSGETSGKLDEVLDYLADEMEKNYDMMSKIKGAMIYPAFILVALVGVAVVLMVYVIPNLTSMMSESNVELPLATRIVIGASDILRGYGILILLALVASVFGVKYYLKTQSGRRNIDTLLIKLPIFGKLFRYIYIMRFARTLSTLLKGGVTITKSLSITANVVRNELFAEAIRDSLERINDGNNLSDALVEYDNLFPKMVPQMVSVGERTGKIDSVLDRVNDFYSRETLNLIGNLSSLMEPIIMVIMAVGVGIMVAAVILPMYNLAGQF